MFFPRREGLEDILPASGTKDLVSGVHPDKSRRDVAATIRSRKEEVAERDAAPATGPPRRAGDL